MNTTCSDDNSPNAAALPPYRCSSKTSFFDELNKIGTRNIYFHGSLQSQRESYRAFSFVRRAQKKLAGASAPWSRRRPKRASTFSLVKRFFFLPEKEMVQTPIISKIIYIIWGHIHSKYIIYNNKLLILVIIKHYIKH